MTKHRLIGKINAGYEIVEVLDGYCRAVKTFKNGDCEHVTWCIGFEDSMAWGRYFTNEADARLSLLSRAHDLNLDYIEELEDTDFVDFLQYENGCDEEEAEETMQDYITEYKRLLIAHDIEDRNEYIKLLGSIDIEPEVLTDHRDGTSYIMF